MGDGFVIRRFDVSRVRNTDTVVGDIAGEMTSADLAAALALHNLDTAVVWNIDLSRCRAVDYRFLHALLAPTLRSIDGADAFVGLSLPLGRQLDILRWALAWDPGQRFSLDTATTELDLLIRRKNRFVTLRDSQAPHDLSYLGLGATDTHLLAILKYAETVSTFDADEVEVKCQLKARAAVEGVQLLANRRLIFPVGDDRFTSVGFALLGVPAPASNNMECTRDDTTSSDERC